MCPWSALSDPYVAEVIRAARWKEDGELSTRYGGRVPLRIIDGIDVYEVARNSVLVHDAREKNREQEHEAAKAELLREAARAPR